MSLIEKNKTEANKFELTVKVDAESFEKALEKAYKKNIKSINMPGFRKGKAPRKMVEKMYGEGVFFEDAINDLYPEALGQAIEEAELDIVARPEVEVLSVDKAEGFTFKATCVVKPEVEVTNYKGIEVEKTVKAVTEEDVDNRVNAMRDRNARLIDVTDRAAQNGDTVVFDFDGYVDGVAFEGGKAEQFSLVLGSGQFIPGFEEQIEGKNIGEEFDVNVTFPEEYHAEELKGKASVFKCKLHEIKCKELAELDDEFAKDVSEFDTLAELRADIKAKMQEQNDKAASDEVENKIIDKVIENMTAEIPNEMIEARIDDMIRDFEYRLQSQGMNLDTYLQYTGMEKDSFRITFKEQAEKQVKIRLALEKIVELENITVDAEAIEAEYAKVAENYKMEVEQVKGFIPEADFAKDLAVNKAIDLIKESAVINEK
ncbi:trigger factor [Paludicola sp. MB14-C6]|uniref:trigger factor n=1 Tax=Paludihabitans sp. MB14-C6 TaxID=3070656 RepID=UPI0027DD2396|nr:trigger factor [Paludicola sp. MB14-C6]WMJ23939.1 trigger factor [Paludicola sp. MB14-C6]